MSRKRMTPPDPRDDPPKLNSLCYFVNNIFHVPVESFSFGCELCSCLKLGLNSPTQGAHGIFPVAFGLPIWHGGRSPSRFAR